MILYKKKNNLIHGESNLRSKMNEKKYDLIYQKYYRITTLSMCFFVNEKIWSNVIKRVSDKIKHVFF